MDPTTVPATTSGIDWNVWGSAVVQAVATLAAIVVAYWLARRDTNEAAKRQIATRLEALATRMERDVDGSYIFIHQLYNEWFNVRRLWGKQRAADYLAMAREIEEMWGRAIKPKETIVFKLHVMIRKVHQWTDGIKDHGAIGDDEDMPPEPTASAAETPK